MPLSHCLSRVHCCSQDAVAETNDVADIANAATLDTYDAAVAEAVAAGVVERVMDMDHMDTLMDGLAASSFITAIISGARAAGFLKNGDLVYPEAAYVDPHGTSSNTVFLPVGAEHCRDAAGNGYAEVLLNPWGEPLLHTGTASECGQICLDVLWDELDADLGDDGRRHLLVGFQAGVNDCACLVDHGPTPLGRLGFQIYGSGRMATQSTPGSECFERHYVVP